MWSGNVILMAFHRIYLVISLFHLFSDDNYLFIVVLYPYKTNLKSNYYSFGLKEIKIMIYVF